MLLLLFLLLFAHCLADYPLQGDFLAQAKDRRSAAGAVIWPWALGSHALIHGGFTFLVLAVFAPVSATVCLALAAAETIAHALIDFGKCEGWFSYHVDQVLHIACKVVWVLVVLICALS